MGKKIGLIFILLGFFVPIVFLPLAEDYFPKASLIINIQKMYIPFGEFKDPTFIRGSLLEELVIEKYGGVKETISDNVFLIIHKEKLRDIKQGELKIIRKYARSFIGDLVELPVFNSIVFDRWITEPRILPYKYVLSFGITFIFIGSMLLIHSYVRS